MDKIEMERRVRALDPWFHYIELPYGIKTRACDDLTNDAKNHPFHLMCKLPALLPTDIRGMRVLDMGCNGGAVTVALAKLGAEVVAADYNPRYVKQTTLLVELFQDQFEQLPLVLEANVEALKPLLDSYFDITFGLGLLYHVPNPVLAIQKLVMVTKPGGTIILESNCTDQIPSTAVDYLGNKKPYTAVWKFGTTCLQEMLAAAGCVDINAVYISNSSRILIKARRA